jgi:hypothetical protein
MEKRSAETLNVIKSSNDFVVRKRNHAVMQWMIVSLSIIMIILSVTVIVTDRLTITSALFTIIGISCWYVSTHMQHNRDLLNATEFQNALFASALSMGHKFCMIITRDGGIIYFDRPFQATFPEFVKQPARSFDVFLDQGQVGDGDKEKIRAAVKQGAYEKITFNIRCAGGEIQKVIMSVEPILRPSGYVLLRGSDGSQA